MKTKETIFTFLAILILASGLSLFVWNRLHGKDLSKPPKFDLSAYENYDLPKNISAVVNEELENTLNKKAGGEQNNATQIEQPPASTEEFTQGYIYFKDSFKGENLATTEELINKFLQDFSELKEFPVDDFDKIIKVEVELPALGREELLKALSSDTLINKVDVVEPPIWQIEFKGAGYEKEFVEYLKQYKDLKVKNSSRQTMLGYIAKVALSDIQLKPEMLEKLQKEYSDVVKIVP